MAEQTYVVLENSKVTNVIMWDPEDEDSASFNPGGIQNIRLVTGPVGIGWELIGSEYFAPLSFETPPPVEDSTVTDAKYQGLAELMQAGISEATARLIVGLPPVEEPT